MRAQRLVLLMVVIALVTMGFTQATPNCELECPPPSDDDDDDSSDDDSSDDDSSDDDTGDDDSSDDDSSDDDSGDDDSSDDDTGDDDSGDDDAEPVCEPFTCEEQVVVTQCPDWDPSEKEYTLYLCGTALPTAAVTFTDQAADPTIWVGCTLFFDATDDALESCYQHCDGNDHCSQDDCDAAEIIEGYWYCAGA